MAKTNNKKIWVWVLVPLALIGAAVYIWKNRAGLKTKLLVAFNTKKTGSVTVENPVIVKDTTSLGVKETGIQYQESPVHGTIIATPLDEPTNMDLNPTLVRFADGGINEQLFHNYGKTDL